MPRLSHGQVMSQLRCRNSHELQKEIKVTASDTGCSFIERNPCQQPKTSDMKKEFSTKAAMEPSGVAFQIHQVVATFQIRKLMNENQTPFQKGCFVSFLTKSSLMKNSGTHAKKMRNGKPLGVHDSQRRIPVRMLSRYK